MLNKDKCRYLLRTAQFDELLKILEKEYVSLLDKFLIKFEKKKELNNLSFSEKTMLVTKYKKDSKMLMYTLANTYLNPDEEIYYKIEDLIDLYVPIYQKLNNNIK